VVFRHDRADAALRPAEYAREDDRCDAQGGSLPPASIESEWVAQHVVAPGHDVVLAVLT
jgi:hypothetical protein